MDFNTIADRTVLSRLALDAYVIGADKVVATQAPVDFAEDGLFASTGTPVGESAVEVLDELIDLSSLADLADTLVDEALRVEVGDDADAQGSGLFFRVCERSLGAGGGSRSGARAE